MKLEAALITTMTTNAKMDLSSKETVVGEAEMQLSHVNQRASGRITVVDKNANILIILSRW